MFASTNVSEIVERPISFAPLMVQALLVGRKTQTRRIVTPQPDIVGRDEIGRAVAIHQGKPFPCPFGNAGDRLWVRERFGYISILGRRDGAANEKIVFAADLNSSQLRGVKWKQSWLMPRSACRIILQITDIRIEPLTRISPADAKSEGYDPGSGVEPLVWFRQLWDQLSAARGNGWRTDPWVWVVGFSIHSVTGDAPAESAS
jgi:hypothetical protein